MSDGFFGLSDELMAVVDADLVLRKVNPSWETTLLRPAAGLVGRRLLEFVGADDRPRLSEAWERLKEEGGRLTLDVHLNSGDGVSVLTSLRAAASEQSGEFLVVARPAPDGPDTKRYEELRARWNAVGTHIHEIATTTDRTGAIVTINRTPPALTPEQVIGQSMFFHVPEDERPALRERFDAVINKGEAFSYEIRAVYPTGEVGVFVSKLGPVFDGQAIIGACLVTRDITVQRQVEDAKRIADQRLREYVRLLKRSNEELERFASVASHDLQEPLRKIQAFGDRLRSRCRDELPEIGQDYLGRMNDAAQRMQHLINDLLTYSRLTSRKRLVTDIDLDRVLRIVASDLEVRVEESGGAIEIGPMPTIEADQTQMQQLFQNLLANALKFARKGIPPVVKVTAELSADGQRVRIDVADNGIGIQAKYHQRIFGIFERLHGRGEYQGTGVGLAVCRKIVEQHGGDIKIVSEEDQGSTFQITLPTKQPKEGDEAR